MVSTPASLLMKKYIILWHLNFKKNVLFSGKPYNFFWGNTQFGVASYEEFM